MRYISSFILIGFVSILFLAFVPVSHSTHHSQERKVFACPFAALLPAVCHSVAMASIHIDVLQSLLSGAYNVRETVSIALLGIALISSLSLFFRRFTPNVAELSVARSRAVSPTTDSSQEKERSWLSLFENSPSFV